MGGTAGVSDFAKTASVQGHASAGFVAGWVHQNTMLEVSYFQSTFELRSARCSVSGCSNYIDPMDIHLDQKNYSLAGKYLFLKGKVRPLAGASFGYVTRDYKNLRDYYTTTPQGVVRAESLPASRGWLGGLIIGADAQVSDQIHLETDLKYLFNLGYARGETPPQVSGNLLDTTEPLEGLSHYVFSLTGNFRF